MPVASAVTAVSIIISDNDFACRAHQYPKDYLGDPDNILCPQLQKPRWMQFKDGMISVNSLELANNNLTRIHELGIQLVEEGNQRNAAKGKNTVNVYKGTRKVPVRNVRAIRNTYFSLDVIHDGEPNIEHCNIKMKSSDVPTGTASNVIASSKSDIVVRLFEVFEAAEDMPAP